ncbi:MAG TPA: hypothetical protein VH189_15235, partial [Rhizomicrobium sp.]|nr:hypothetical protein [Rhizomicrobium sp.]
DEWSNFEGLAEYPGAKPGAIEIQGVATEPRIDREASQESISDMSIELLTSGMLRLKVVCYGQYLVEVVGREICWISNVRSASEIDQQ